MDPAPFVNTNKCYYLQLNDIFPLQLDITIDGNENESLTFVTFEELVESPNKVNEPRKISIVQDQNSTRLYCFDSDTFNEYGGRGAPNPLTRGAIQRVFCFQYAGDNRFIQEGEACQAKMSPSVKIDVEKLFTPVKVTNALIYAQDIKTEDLKNPFPQIIALTFHEQKYHCFDAVLCANNQEIQKVTNILFFKLSEKREQYKLLHEKKELSEQTIGLFYKALAGNKEAQLQLGNYYTKQKEEIEKNRGEAFFWYTRAFEQGCLQAEVKLGEWYLGGKATKSNHLEAKKVFENVLRKKPDNVPAKTGLSLALTRLSEYEKAFDLVKNLNPTKEIEYVRGAYYLLDPKAKIKKKHICHLKNSAEKGFLDGKNLLGTCYLEVKQYEQAFKLFSEAADENNPLAWHNLYFCYKEGFGVEINEIKAVECLKKAAERGVAHAFYQLGIMFYMGFAVEKSEEEAFKWLQEAIKEDYHDAYYLFGIMCLYKGDQAQGVEYLEKATSFKKKEAAYALYEHYKSCHQDQKALEALELAAKLQHSEAAYTLFIYYQDSKPKKAFEALKLAVQLKHGRAHFYFGYHWSQLHTREGNQRAIFWWEKGADLKDIECAKMLVRCFENGLGVKQDFKAAAGYQVLVQKLEEAQNIANSAPIDRDLWIL